MANNLNKHQCIGRLGQDVELKYMPSGEAVANLSVACSESWKDKNTGQKQERTTWIKYVAFGKLAEIMGEYLKKGSKVYLSGKLRERKWTDQQGIERYTTEIVASDMEMLDSLNSQDHQPQQGGYQQQAPQQRQQPQNNQPQRQQNDPRMGSGVSHPQPAPGMDDFDDDIPFANPYKGMEYMI